MAVSRNEVYKGMPPFRITGVPGIAPDAGDEGCDDPRAPFQQIPSHEGVDQGAFAAFNGTHHGDPDERIVQGAGDEVEVLVPESGLLFVHQSLILEPFHRAAERVRAKSDSFLESGVVVHRIFGNPCVKGPKENVPIRNMPSRRRHAISF